MGRRTSRKHAFIIVYQSEFHEEFDVSEAAELYFSSVPELKLSDDDTKFVLSEAGGALENKEEIDRLISSNLHGWSLERVGRVDLALMRLAVYEILYATDIPVQVAINEAVELSKKYGDDESPSFLNGVLGKIALIVQ